MAKPILSAIFDNQELLYKITSGLNTKINAKDISIYQISGEVSAMVNDYKQSIPSLASSLYDFSTHTNSKLNGFTLERNVSAVVDELSSAIKNVIDGSSGLSLSGLNIKINEVSSNVSSLASSVTSSINTLYQYIDTQDQDILSTAILSSIISANLYTDTRIATLSGIFRIKGYYDPSDHSVEPPVPAVPPTVYQIGDVYLVDKVSELGIEYTIEKVWVGDKFEDLGTLDPTSNYATIAYVDMVSGNLHNEITGLASTYVTQEIFADIASTTKADNEALAQQYIALYNQLSSLFNNL